MMMATEILTVSNVTKKYNENYAVKKLSFTVHEGEVVGLVGPNGAGKTTIMRIIMGLIHRFDGQVMINDRLKTSQKHHERRRRISCVIESPSFYPHLSGHANLRYFAEISGGYHPSNVQDIVGFMGLEHAIHKKVKHYSLGMKQRLGIAQALLNEPELLILDEPTNGLDPIGVLEMRKIIQQIVHEKSISVLISSHILHEIEAICDRVLLMRNGELIKNIHLNQKGRSQDFSTYIIETVDVDQLQAFLTQINELDIIEKHDKRVIFRYNSSEIETLIRSLVFGNVRFNAIYQDKQSLEAQFFDLLGGNRIE